MNIPDIRWRQRSSSFRKALTQLNKAEVLARQRPLTELEEQGFIHVFEFTHELAWKTMKDFLDARGTAELFGSRDATREAFATGLIDHGEIWMEMINSRNRTSHTYDEATAAEIARSILSVYWPEFEKLRDRMVHLEEDNR